LSEARKSTTYQEEFPKPVIVAEKGMVAEPIKLALIFLLILAVSYLVYDKYKSKNELEAKIAGLADRIKELETSQNVAAAAFTSRVSVLESGLEQAVDNTKETLEKTATQLKAEGNKTREELTQAINVRANTLETKVQAAKADAEARINQVNTEVGGVREEVALVKTDLAGTRKDLEGTQRQIVDVNDKLSAAVAKNSAELAQLRLKGERDYFEFTIPDKKALVKVGDIRLQLTKTDVKKGTYTIRVFVDDNKLEKKDRQINEPLALLVGQNRVRYEVVVNWVQKDRVGGYLSIPKDKILSSERP
jgi:predicted  nucleic acid-binding Zn-ribbon protein